MVSIVSSLPSSSSSSSLSWRPTKIMNMRDLSKDDDFLSHLLVEKLGTGTVPLLVHKMDPSRRLPKTDANDLLQVVRRLVAGKGPIQHVIRQAVDDLLKLPSIRYYLKSYTQKQINAFATHASRYLELYHPSGSIEIAHTSRYSHRTGKSELCILATRPLPAGAVITELKGSMANLTDEEDKELKRTDMRNSDIRRDFSVIHSKQMKKNHLFLGPARFVNHDCDNNCELFREGKYITFRVLKPIQMGEEITAHYGDGYFGRNNRHCLCETCEKNLRGGYAPDHTDVDPEPYSDSCSDSDSDSDTSSSASDGEPGKKPTININERRTRRGVYAVVNKDDDSDESENEEDDKMPLADANDIPADGEIEMTTEIDTASELNSLTTIMPPPEHTVVRPVSSLSTPSPDVDDLTRLSSSLTSVSSATPKSASSTPFRSIISTRRQKAREGTASSKSLDCEPTPPLSEDQHTNVSTPTKRITRSNSFQVQPDKENGKGKDKGKEREPTNSTGSTPQLGRKRLVAGNDEVRVKKEETETRVLRARPSTSTVAEIVKEQAPKRDVPRGPDGKILPTCFTCHSVLPVITVNSEVVWGLGVEGSRKRKKQECPRCLRHFAIYGQPWPKRVLPNGSAFLPTPREMTPTESSFTRRVTQKDLSVLDRKLAAAASAAGKSKKRNHENNTDDKAQEERPSKKRKIDQDILPRMGAKERREAKKLAKKEARKEAKKAFLASLASNCQTPQAEEPIKRKRGRPRLSSPRASLARIIKVEPNATDAPKILSLQPRNPNGRFGKKDKSLLKSKMNSVNGTGTSPRSERSRTDDENGGGGDSPKEPRSRKRSGNSSAEAGDSPRKKALRSYIGATGAESVEPSQRVLPRPTFHAGRLVSNPNPLSFALRAWGGPVMLYDSSSSEEDEKPPVTPEDDHSSPAEIVSTEETMVIDVETQATREEEELSFTPLPRAPLTFKPSPMAYAQRRRVISNPSLARLVFGIGGTNDGDIKKKEMFVTPLWKVKGKGKQLSDEVTAVPLSRQSSPLSDGYPSGLSSSSIDGERVMVSMPGAAILRQILPVAAGADSAAQYRAASTFAAPQQPAPKLSGATWD